MGEKIVFGDIFKVVGDPKRTDVVIKVNDNGSFDAAKLNNTSKGKRWIFGAGTALYKNVDQTIGQMGLEDIIDAVREGRKQMGVSVGEETIESLTKASKKNT